MTQDIRSTQEQLPWLVPITDGIVTCKDSSFLACFEFTGADADSVSEGEVYQVAQAADRLLNSFRDLPVTIWWTVRRERTEDYPGEVMPTQVAQMLDDEHRAAFLHTSAYVNRHFFSIIWMPEKSASGMFEKVGLLAAEGVPLHRAIVDAVKSTYFMGEAFAWKASEIGRAISDFEERLQQIENMMSGSGFRRLEGMELNGFLWAQANPGSQMVPKSWDGESFLDGYLSEKPITVHGDSLEFGDGPESVKVNMISMKSWPTPLAFGAFTSLISLPCEMVLSHCFRVMNSTETMKHIDSVKRMNDLLKYPIKSWAFGLFKNGGAMNEASADPFRAQASEDAMAAKGDYTSGRILFGYHNLSIALIGRDFDELENSTRTLQRMLSSSPFVGVMREGMHALSAWSTTLPGQWQECSRWMTLSSENCVDLAPIMGVSMGERMNNHASSQLGKPCQALTVLNTDFNTPFYFNFHVGALGHAFVVGPSRSGKSIGMNFLISQFQKYGDSCRTLIFDKDYSCRIPTLLQGGGHIDLKRGGEIRLNPIGLCSDKNNWGFIANWVEDRIQSRGHKVSAEEAKAIYRAVEMTASLDSSQHRLMTIRTFLDPMLGIHLDEWIGTGNYADYFDNLDDSFSISDFAAIEMGEVMKEPRVARAFMDYAFYRIQRQLEAQREGQLKMTMIYVEEAWFLISDETFASRLKDWLKTFAKLNAFLILCTQSVEDMLELPQSIFASVRDNIQTRIFLPNPNALSEGLSKIYKKQFELRDELVERIATGVPRQDYIIVQPEVARKVHLNLSRQQVAALRSDIAAQRVFAKHYPACKPGWEFDYINEVQSV